MTVMNKLTHLVSLVLDEHRYALPLNQVERVIPSIEITPLPYAPEIIAGVINFLGRIIPIVNIRKRFRLPERDITLDDQIIISKTTARPVALVVDQVIGVIEIPVAAVTNAEKILPGMKYTEGVIKLEDGMILIHDLDGFLSLEEVKKLNQAFVKR